MLKTKSILKEREASDGIRISVMSRHTLNDGITPDPRIKEGSFDIWRKFLAPSPKLVGAYYRKEKSWEEFETEYLSYLRTPAMANNVQELASEALEKTVTILCVEETAERCHRRLLAEECQNYESSLEIIHL